MSLIGQCDIPPPPPPPPNSPTPPFPVSQIQPRVLHQRSDNDQQHWLVTRCMSTGHACVRMLYSYTPPVRWSVALLWQRLYTPPVIYCVVSFTNLMPAINITPSDMSHWVIISLILVICLGVYVHIVIMAVGEGKLRMRVISSVLCCSYQPNIDMCFSVKESWLVDPAIGRSDQYIKACGM